MITEEVWKNDLESEVSFWENWLRTQGADWKEEYKMRLDPDSKLQEIFLSYLDRKVAKNRILDVGAGPLTAVNKRCDLLELEICAVDALADEFDDLLKRYSIQPIVRTQKCDGEKLSETFAENIFEITYSRNALDHSYNPLKCIKEMIKVTRKDRYIILQVFEREGSHQEWNGLHKWDFFIRKKYFLGKAHFYLQGKKRKKIDLTNSLESLAQVVYLNKMGREITAVFKKL